MQESQMESPGDVCIRGVCIRGTQAPGGLEMALRMPTSWTMMSASVWPINDCCPWVVLAFAPAVSDKGWLFHSSHPTKTKAQGIVDEALKTSTAAVHFAILRLSKLKTRTNFASRMSTSRLQAKQPPVKISGPWT